MRYSRYNIQTGFTLVEMIVAVGIFTIVVFVATGALLSTVLVNKRVQAKQAVINNLNYALEGMAREIRVGNHYYCASLPPSVPSKMDCANSDTLSFQDSQGRLVTYRREVTGFGKITRSVSGSVFVAITGPEIDVKDLTFRVSGSSEDPSILQPKVLISISGEAFYNEQKPDAKVDFALQTTVSQRIIDTGL